MTNSSGDYYSGDAILAITISTAGLCCSPAFGFWATSKLFPQQKWHHSWRQSQDWHPRFCVFLAVLFPYSWIGEHWWANNNGWKLNSPPVQLSEHYQSNTIKAIQHLSWLWPALGEKGGCPREFSGVVENEAIPEEKNGECSISRCPG